jgi:hypothetical protein
VAATAVGSKVEIHFDMPTTAYSVVAAPAAIYDDGLLLALSLALLWWMVTSSHVAAAAEMIM